VNYSQEPARSPRLNPFAFPSDTDFRFVVLVAAILGSCLYMYNWLFNVVPGSSRALVETAARCQAVGPRAQNAGAAIQDLLGLNVTQTPQQAAFVAASNAYASCIAPYNQALALWMLGGVALVWALGFAIYWVIPTWKIKRGNLVPLPMEDVPEVGTYLQELSAEAELRKPPTFLWNPLNQAPSGVAFGRLGRYYVALTGGLVRTFYTDRERFRGIMLHELAHLRNGDVDKTYLSVAVTLAFVVAAVTPFALVLARADSDTALQLLWRVAVLIGLVAFSFCAVLRSRETYADVRASSWGASANGLRQVLKELPSAHAGGWQRWLRLHPEPRDRIAHLESTDSLFGLQFWEAFAAGLAVAIAAPNVQNLIQVGTTRVQQATLGPLVAGLIFGPLLVGIVGLQVWRATFAARARGRPTPRVGVVALGVAAGLALGQPLSLRAAIGTTDQPNDVMSFVFNLLWGGLALIGLALFFRWLMGAASTWLEVSFESRSPQPSYVLGLTVASGVLAAWLAVLFFLRDFAEIVPLGPASLASLGIAVLLVLGVPLVTWWILPGAVTFAAVISVWALPLGAWLRSRASTPRRASWAFLDRPASIAGAGPGGVSLRGPLRTGLVAAVVFVILLIVLRFGARLIVSEATRDSDQFKVGFYVLWLLLATLVEAGVAATVAWRATQLAAVQGLFAASVAGFAMAMGILTVNLVFGGTLGPGFAGQTVWLVIAGGSLVVTPVALASAALGGRNGRVEQSSESALEAMPA
jgi:Zn-dependent protease with chaperone function